MDDWLDEIRREAERVNQPTPAQRRCLYRFTLGRKLVHALTKEQASKIISVCVEVASRQPKENAPSTPS